MISCLVARDRPRWSTLRSKQTPDAVLISVQVVQETAVGWLPCLSTHQGGVSSSSGAGRDEGPLLLVITGVQSRGASSAAGTTHMSAQPPAIPFVIKYIRLAE